MIVLALGIEGDPVHKAVKPTAAASLAALVLVGTLSGCTGPQDPRTSRPSPDSTSHSSISSASPRTGTAPTPAPTRTAHAAEWNVARDSGPVEGAEGSVVTNAEGVPIHYSVASGDTEGAICNRLNVRWWQLMSDGEFLGTYPILMVGQTIDIVDVARSAAGPSDSSNALC